MSRQFACRFLKLARHSRSGSGVEQSRESCPRYFYAVRLYLAHAGLLFSLSMFLPTALSTQYSVVLNGVESWHLYLPADFPFYGAAGPSSFYIDFCYFVFFDFLLLFLSTILLSTSSSIPLHTTADDSTRPPQHQGPSPKIKKITAITRTTRTLRITRTVHTKSCQ